MSNKILYQVFPFVATFLYSVDFLLHGTIFIIVGFVLIIPYLFKYGNYLLKYAKLGSFVFMVFMGSIFNLLTTQNGIGGTINFIACIGIALFCINNLRFTGLFVALACFTLLYYVYDAMFIQGIDANYVFESKGQSRNYPGFMFVIFVCFWGFTKYVNYYSYPFLLPILALILCFFLEGRSSLGFMIAVCAICLFYHGKRYLVLFLSIVFFALLYYWNDLVDLFYLSQFADKGLESERNIIWNSYFNSLDPLSLLFGLDTLSVPAIKEYGGNPHNSFLNFHYRMGFLGIFALVILIINSLKILLSQKQFILCLYIFILLGRCFFDSCIGGPTDFMLYTMLFYPIVKYHNPNNVKISRCRLCDSRFINKIIKII